MVELDNPGAVGAADKLAKEYAIAVLATRFRLHALAIDRSRVTRRQHHRLTRDQVESMVTALPRNY